MPEPVRTHTGRAIPLRRRDVDTDQIIPSEHCRRLTKTGYADALFARWRAEPDFVIDRPERAGASVLVAGPHFGTGSSREHAVWALRDWGVRAVIAPSFGDIFARNAMKNGLLVAALPAVAVDLLLDRAEADPAVEITVDLVDLRVRACGREWPFTADARARSLLLEGLDDIAVTLALSPAITAYEARRPTWLPRPSSPLGRPA